MRKRKKKSARLANKTQIKYAIRNNSLLVLCKNQHRLQIKSFKITKKMFKSKKL